MCRSPEGYGSISTTYVFGARRARARPDRVRDVERLLVGPDLLPLRLDRLRVVPLHRLRSYRVSSSRGQKSLSRRGSGEVLAAAPRRSLIYGRSRTIAGIVPPARAPPSPGQRPRRVAGPASTAWRETYDRRRATGDAARLDATAPRRGLTGRLRRRGVQRQQHGADPGDHGGRARHLLAGDHPGLARCARLHERPVPLAPDAGRRRAVPGDPGRAPPRSRQRAGDVHLGDRPRLHERDDGRVARGRRQDAGRVRLQRRRHERGRRVRPRTRRHGRGRARNAWRNRGRPRLGRGAPDRPRRGGGVRPCDGHRRPGGRDRDVPRRLQVRSGARRRGAEDGA